MEIMNFKENKLEFRLDSVSIDVKADPFLIITIHGPGKSRDLLNSCDDSGRIGKGVLGLEGKISEVHYRQYSSEKEKLSLWFGQYLSLGKPLVIEQETNYRKLE